MTYRLEFYRTTRGDEPALNYVPGAIEGASH